MSTEGPIKNSKMHKSQNVIRMLLLADWKNTLVDN